MTKSWQDMTQREKDVRIAEWLGWTEIAGPQTFPDYGGYHLDPVGVPPDGTSERVLVDSAGIKGRVPAFTVNPIATRLVLDEVEQCGLQEPYIEHLVAVAEVVFLMDQEATLGELFKLLRATPDQQCEAVYRMTQPAIKSECVRLRLSTCIS